MAPPPVTHPSADALRAFALGKLDDSTAAELMSHLDGCTDCCKIVTSQSGDDFLKRLRLARSQGSTPVPASMISKSAVGPKPSPSHAAIPNLPTELANNPQYEIVRELGRGGMGIVYLAKNKLMDRLEVLKVVNKALLDHPGAVERFLREIRSAAKLSHTNVVGAFSAVQQGELLAFAMEYIEGQDLASLVKSQGPLPIQHACYYVHQAALGLQHAFEKGMVHRDIKPQNLILAREGKKHIVKVLDFGLAKATREKKDDAGLTGEGKMLGTPDYIAPEQTLDAAKADIRADIYSLGCTLYYLLSGHPPFSANSLGAILLAHQMQDAKPLNLVRPEVPEELSAVVRKMMAKLPAKRYQTPLEVVQALGPFVKQGTTPKASPELSSSGVKAKPAVKPATPVAPPPAPAAKEANQPEPAAVWQSLTDGSAASPVSKKSGAAGRHRAATKTERTAPKKWLMGGGIGMGLLLLTLLAMWAGGMFQGKVEVKTEDGILVLEVNEPNPVVLVDDQSVTVSWHNGGKKAEIRVKPGTHKVEIQKDGFSVDGKELTFNDGDRVVFTARLLPQEREAKTDLGPPALNAQPVDTPPPTPTQNDYDALAKGRWVALLPSEEVFRRLLAEKAFEGNEPKYVGGIVGFNGHSKLYLPAVPAKDFIVRAWVKRSGPTQGGNAGITVYPANGQVVGTGFNGDGHFFVGRMTKEGWRDYRRCHLPEPYDDFFEYAFAVVGDKLIVYANGRKILEARSDVPLDRLARIHVGLHRQHYGEFRNMEMQVLDKPQVEAKGPVEVDGFVPLFNGKDLTGWKHHPTQPGDWRVANSVLVSSGRDTSHLYTERADYKDFHLRVEARINPTGDSGVEFRTGFGSVYPAKKPVYPLGYEAQIYGGEIKPGFPRSTGSLYAVGHGPVVGLREPPQRSYKWFTLEVIAEAYHIVLKVNGQTTADYIDEKRLYRSGHIALQQFNAHTVAEFRRIEIKELPAGPSSDRAGDSVSPEAKEAVQAYEKACAGARAKLLAEFDSALGRLAKMKGSTEERLKLIEAVKEERKRFEEKGLIPWSAPMRPYVEPYLKTIGAEQGKLSRIYESLIDAQLRAKYDSKAAELREERKNRLDIRVLAKWRSFFNGKEWDFQTLYSDGTFSNGKTHNIRNPVWRYDKSGLTLISPDANAPGGSWISILKVSEDGTEFNGTNNARPPAKHAGVYLKDN